MIAELQFLEEPVKPIDATGLTAPTGLTGPETGLTDQTARNTSLAMKKAEDQDLRVPIISYLKDPGRGAERNIRPAAFKYILIDDELYRRTAEDLLLKCLDSDQAKVAMGEVQEGICGTHQSAPKIKWLLRRAGFYGPSMILDCFKYYKGLKNVNSLEICNWYPLH